MKIKKILLLVLIAVIVWPCGLFAEAGGFWKFSHILRDDSTEKGANDLFSNEASCSNDEFKNNGACSLILNSVTTHLKTGKKQVFRARYSMAGIPTKLFPGQEYSIDTKIEQTEFHYQFYPQDAYLNIMHSDELEDGSTVNKSFFKIDLKNLIIKTKKDQRPVSASKVFKFKPRGKYSKGKEFYAIKLDMVISGYRAKRIFVYKWHTEDSANDFNCPHCGKVIDKNLLPRD